MRKFRRTTLLASCILVAILVFSQDTQWKEYVYAEDGFAISAPLEPRTYSNYRYGEKGEGIVGHSYLFPLTIQERDGSGYEFLLKVSLRQDSDLRTPEQLLNDAKNLYASYLGTSYKLASPATVVYEKPISLGKYPGLELEMQHECCRYLGRFYVVDRKTYSLTVGTYTQRPFPEEMQRWHNSFHLIEAKSKAMR
jgi:hypothetical protein